MCINQSNDGKSQVPLSAPNAATKQEKDWQLQQFKMRYE
jgi:hypothetical protein